MKIFEFIEKRWWSFIGTLFGILAFLGISVLDISGVFVEYTWILEIIKWIALAIAIGFSCRSYALTRLDIPRIIFVDNFDDASDWRRYGDGEVGITNENSLVGNHSLKKDSHSDPHGGFKLLNRTIKAPFIFSGWIYRSDIANGRWADRLAIEDENNNGYGFSVSHGNRAIGIERRDEGVGTFLPRSGQPTPPLNRWYHFQFYVGLGGTLSLSLYDRNGVQIIGAISVKDKEYKSFDRIVIHGGYPYYIDDLRIMST